MFYKSAQFKKKHIVKCDKHYFLWCSCYCFTLCSTDL